MITQSINVFSTCCIFFILFGLLFRSLLLEQTSNTFRNSLTLNRFLLVLLPDIRTSDNYIDKNRPLPSSLQKDYIPDDILFALTQTPQGQELLGPSARLRNINTSTVRIKQLFEKVSFIKQASSYLQKLTHLIDDKRFERDVLISGLIGDVLWVSTREQNTFSQSFTSSVIGWTDHWLIH